MTRRFDNPERRQAAKAAAMAERDAIAARRRALVEEGVGLEQLCRIAEEHGWMMGLSADDELALHVFQRPVPRHNTPAGKRAWRMRPHGHLMAYAIVVNGDFDGAAALICAEILTGAT